MATATRPVGTRENEPGKAKDGQRTRRSSEPAEAAQLELSVTALLLGAFMVVAVGAVVLAGVDRVGPALLWCFGCLVSGFVVGFLFGFPRVITYDKPAATPAVVTDADNPASAVAYRLGVNTNLEQVSDWLTKIIVGVGLVELKNVPGYLRAAGEYIGAGFGDTAGALVFQQRLAAGIVVAFGGLGVLSGYLLTRMFFSAAFRRADAGTIGIGEEQGRTIAAIPLERDGQKVQLPEATRAASEKLVGVSLRSVAESPSERAAWARVQFEAGQYESAINGYEDAVAKNPLDARLRHSYAIAMKYGHRPPADYMFQLEKALSLARSSSDPGLRRDVYASYTFNALYLDPPDGFLRARDAAEEYVRNTNNPPSGDVWLNLACAYGQQYDFESSKALNADAETLRALRGKALDALKSTVSVDPRLKPRAQQLLDGRAEGDDDLKAFKDGKEFREAVGLPAP